MASQLSVKALELREEPYSLNQNATERMADENDRTLDRIFQLHDSIRIPQLL